MSAISIAFMHRAALALAQDRVSVAGAVDAVTRARLILELSQHISPAIPRGTQERDMIQRLKDLRCSRVTAGLSTLQEAAPRLRDEIEVWPPTISTDQGWPRRNPG